MAVAPWAAAGPALAAIAAALANIPARWPPAPRRKTLLMHSVPHARGRRGTDAAPRACHQPGWQSSGASLQNSSARHRTSRDFRTNRGFRATPDALRAHCMQTPGQGPGVETGGSSTAAEDRGCRLSPASGFLRSLFGLARILRRILQNSVPKSPNFDTRLYKSGTHEAPGFLRPREVARASTCMPFSPQKTPTTMAPTKANAAHTAKRLILRTSVISWPPAVSRYMKDKLPEPAGKAKKMLRCVADTMQLASLVRNVERNRRFRPCSQSSFAGGNCSPAPRRRGSRQDHAAAQHIPSVGGHGSACGEKAKMLQRFVRY